jgi:CRP-like cAMP-binding protein
MSKKKTKTYKDNFVTVDEEFKIGELGAGTVIGELAMMDPKATRLLSGMAKTDCIFLLLNRDAFDILVNVI